MVSVRLLWLLSLLLMVACRPPLTRPEPVGPQVRYRPTAPPDAAAAWLVAEVGGQWDAGLAAASGELLAAMQSRSARITPDRGALAAARAGYPGQARFARVLTGDGAQPEAVVADLLSDSGGRSLDVGLARRDYADGISVWVVGWAPHIAELDPLPSLLPLDAPLMLRVDLAQERDSRLYVAPPDGPVEELEIRSGVARVLDIFHTPGAYRLEVIAGENLQSEVALLFSVFVDRDLPTLPVLTDAPPPPPDPQRAEVALYAALQTLRGERGLPPVTRFPLFEGIAREHSALMAASGAVRHRIPGVTEGVPSRAEAVARPSARHHESVAAAASPEEAMALIAASPAHLRELLCAACTHASIGVALEPALDRPPRLFVTWELLEFPAGQPHPVYAPSPR